MSIVRLFLALVIGYALSGCGGDFDAKSDTYVMDQGQSIEITLEALNPPDSGVSFATLTLPPNGELTGTPPNLRYTPTPTFYGDDSFTFTATATIEGAEVEKEGVITITVNQIPIQIPQRDVVSGTARSVSVNEQYTLIELKRSFVPLCGQFTQVAMANMDEDLRLTSALNSMVLSRPLEILVDECVESQGSTYPKVVSIKLSAPAG